MTESNCSLSNAIDLPEAHTWTIGEKLAILAFVPFVTLVGNVGNLAFLLTGLRVPRMRTVANMYLFNLAVSDVLFLSTVCAVYLWTYAASPVIYTMAYNSATWCWLIYYPHLICYYASIQTVTLVSFERYFAICQPLKHRSFAGKQRTKKQIAGSWLLAAILAAFFTVTEGDVQNLFICVSSIAGDPLIEPIIVTIVYCKNLYGFVWFSLIGEIITDVLFLSALISSSITYAKIIHALTKREDTNLQSNQDDATNNVRRQVTAILVVNGVVFFICQIPYRFYGAHNITSNVLQVWSLNEGQLANFIVVTRIFLYVNSAVNPYIYLLGSKYYREAFMEAICCCKSSSGKAAKVIASSEGTVVSKI